MTPTELDELMSLDPLSLSDQDIDHIIAYHRKQRAMHEAGIKPEKSGGKVDLVALGMIPAPAPIKRRL